MWKDAEYLNHQIVEMGMKKLRKKHPSTLTSMENLAVTYAHQGKYEQAEELMLNVLDLSSVEQGFWKPRGYVGKGSEGRGQGTEQLTPHKPLPVSTGKGIPLLLQAGKFAPVF